MEKVGRGADNRMCESREMLLKAMMMSLGSYTEQEAKKRDTWRDQTIGQLYAHLKHELEEVRRSLECGEKTILIHNLMDMCSLSAILLAKLMFEKPKSLNTIKTEGGDGATA
jgi:hypothetical protein